MNDEIDKKLRVCEKCSQPSTRCSDCYHYVCVQCNKCLSCTSTLRRYYYSEKDIQTCRPHNRCLECNDKTVCHLKKICGLCDKPFHPITDTVTVGSCGTPYDDYDLIFNLNYPENGAEKHSIKLVYGYRPNIMYTHTTKKKNFYNIGMHDRNDKKELDVLRNVIQILKDLVKTEKETGVYLKILFHCFAGYSRSVAVATAYLALKEGINVDDALLLIKSKRKYIGPNQSFIKVIKEELGET